MIFIHSCQPLNAWRLLPELHYFNLDLAITCCSLQEGVSFQNTFPFFSFD
jgi:hypothetical protein